MMASITVREYARLTTDVIGDDTLDRARISISAFDWLCRLSAGFSRSGASLVEIEDRRWLRLDNYVGVVETPCGTRIEILPKHIGDGDDAKTSRTLLKRMILAALELSPRQAGPASLDRFDSPITEWMVGRFLGALDYLVKRGLRSDYVRVSSAEHYLRGQLDVARQARQPPGREHLFQIRHDIFFPDGPENRLLKAALEQVSRATKSAAHWQLASELRALLHDVPTSGNINDDFKRWRGDRLMAHYRPVLPLCELILHSQMPLALAGEWQGISMLFPMEKLFEAYVTGALRSELADGAQLHPQTTRASLCSHLGTRMFQLKPDMFVTREASCWVLDAKWKLLDQGDRLAKYQLNQADFYQLFAYGHKYMAGRGEMFLVYPLTSSFTNALPVFEFGDGLCLRVIPFDLEARRFIGLEQTNFPLKPSSAAPECFGHHDPLCG